jgi:methionyl-tRNA synthetase
MSKSRGNFLDPLDFVAAFGADGARFVVLREVPFDRDSDVSWDGFLRRYNADLANDFGNLVNRTVSMGGRYLAGERPAPRPAADAPLAGAWAATLEAVAGKLDACLIHDALAALWDYVGLANKTVDAEAPWALAKAARGGDDDAARRLRDILGDLLEACRLVALTVAPVMPGAAPRVLAQLGFAYPWDDRGTGGPSLLDELVWGAHAAEPGTLAAPTPLFPRLEIEAVGAEGGATDTRGGATEALDGTTEAPGDSAAAPAPG